MSAWCPDGYAPFLDLLRVIAKYQAEWETRKFTGVSPAVLVRDRLKLDSGLSALGRGIRDVIAPLLVNGKLVAYGLETDSGDLVTIPTREWRVQPPRSDWHAMPASMCEWALIHSTMHVTIPEKGYTRVRPVLSLRGLAMALDAKHPPAEPEEEPDPHLRADEGLPKAETANQVFWFLAGYAVRAREAGTYATREECRAAASREGVADMRLAEAQHKELPAKLKNPSKAKGGERAG